MAIGPVDLVGLNAARESPKPPIDPQPYVEPSRGRHGQALTPLRKAQSDATKALWDKRRADGTAPYPRKVANAAVDVLLALGYVWAEDAGWMK
jgi:hypothetical protein